MIPRTLIRSIAEDLRPRTTVDRAVAATRQGDDDAREHGCGRRNVNAPRLRAGFRCARLKRLSAGAVTGIQVTLERAQHGAGNRADGAGAQQHDTRSPGFATTASSRGTSLEHPDDRTLAAEPLAHGIRERIERHTRLSVLAGGIDLGQHHHIGAHECAAELIQQKLRASEAMRLKGDDQTPLRDRPCRGDDCRDFGRWCP